MKFCPGSFPSSKKALLRKLGQRAARRFLDAHYADIGVQSSIDLNAEVYSERG